jgi:hypothetical protein
MVPVWVIVITILATLIVEVLIASFFLLVVSIRQQRTTWDNVGFVIGIGAFGLLLLTFLGLVVMASG